ncbi:hypothetical protein DCAR_0519239 [Daucus carota subsp. sativus]|uniref:Uncharacterized protein n=1 Tax=Daucus carota subsp. sativus TaxID=79200 RepID=A0AAF1AYC6_DAUCS|nr:hypothetical protein DCAR_0519239 [Daucus carota subsp. sativus]
MVRTRSGVEVRITQKQNDEDEIVIEDDNAGEDDGVDASDGEDENPNNGEETLVLNFFTFNKKNLYNVELYYGGHFVHVPYESYTSSVKRVYKHVDLEKLSIDELKSCFKGPVGEKEGHKRDKCPDKHLYPEHSKGKKGGAQEKQPAPDPMEEESAEVHLQEQEILTGEDDLMNETMAEMETSVAQEAGPSKGMKFMPTPSLIQLTSTGCTPPASTPPTPAS